MSQRFKDLTGMRFGRLTVLSFSGEYTPTSHNAIWMCKCDCGNTVLVSSGKLSYKGMISCGCYRRDRASALNRKHGGRNERLYLVWIDMRRRCRDQKCKCYEMYGGRGIKVCDEWEDYDAFRSWAYLNGYDESAVKQGCTIDRIDTDGDYAPSNCRWVDSQTQNNNKRSNHLVEFDGRIQTVAEWSRELGFDKGLAYKRLSAGWSPKDAFLKPSRATKRFPAGNRLK